MSQCDKCQNDTHWTAHYCDICGVICDECHNKCDHKVKAVSSRRNFLKKLGIGAVSVPVAIKLLGDQKAKACHEKMPKYKGSSEGDIDYSTASNVEQVYIATSDDGFVLIDSRFGTATKLNNEQLKRMNLCQ